MVETADTPALPAGGSNQGLAGSIPAGGNSHQARARPGGPPRRSLGSSSLQLVLAMTRRVKKKRGRREERLVIEGDPVEALRSFLKIKPSAATRKRKGAALANGRGSKRTPR